MNIKTVEQKTAITSQNIRYYEKVGLINPKRNLLNSYREYTQEDIRKLKLIKMFRMIDMPVEQIKSLLNEEISIQDAVKVQQKKLERKADQINGAIMFCNELSNTKDTIDILDVDSCLSRMEYNQINDGFFVNWINDYMKIINSEHRRRFSFTPDNPITNAREFTTALLKHAQEKNLNMVITKEGLNPEFTIDGIEYAAERNYAASSYFPVAVVNCEMKHKEDYESNVKEPRAKYMRLLYIGLPAILEAIVFAVCFLGNDISKEKMGLFSIFTIVAIAMAIRNYFLY